MFVIMSFYRFLYFMKTRKLPSFFLAFAYIAAACMMHSGVIALALIYIVCIPLRQTDSIKKVFMPRYLVPALFFIGILTLTPIWKSMFAKTGDFNSLDDVVARAGQFTEGEANTRYVSDMPESISLLILQIPYRTVLFAFVPLPWMIISLDTALSWVLDAAPQMFIAYRTVRLLFMTRRNKKYRLYVVVFVLIILGMGTTAYGNAIRHRAKILLIAVSFIIGLYTHFENRRKRSNESFNYNPGI